MKVKLRQVSEYLYHVEAYSEKWGWIDLTERGHPVPLVDARRIQREAQAVYPSQGKSPWLNRPGAGQHPGALWSSEMSTKEGLK